MQKRALIEYLAIGVLLVLVYGLVFLIASPAHAMASEISVPILGTGTGGADYNSVILASYFANTGATCSVQYYLGTYPDTSNGYATLKTDTCSNFYNQATEFTLNPSNLENIYFTHQGGYPADGDYWFDIITDGTNHDYTTFTKSAGVWTNGSTPVSATTTIQVTAPTQGTSTPSTTLDIGADYNIGTDLAQYSLDGSLPQQIGIRLTLLNTATNQTISLGIDYAIATSTGTHSYATTTTQIAGDYTLIAELVGNYGTISPPSGCTPFPPFTTCDTTTNINVLATSLPPITFALDNGTFPLIGFQVGSTTSRNGLATTTCSITQIGGCFQNALAFLFYPSPNALDGYATIWENIKNKPPFGYVTITIASLGGFGASSTPAFTFPVLPLMDTIFTPLRTGIGALLWLLFGVMFYKRLRHLDI